MMNGREMFMAARPPPLRAGLRPRRARPRAPRGAPGVAPWRDATFGNDFDLRALGEVVHAFEHHLLGRRKAFGDRDALALMALLEAGEADKFAGSSLPVPPAILAHLRATNKGNRQSSASLSRATKSRRAWDSSATFGRGALAADK